MFNRAQIYLVIFIWSLHSLISRLWNNTQEETCELVNMLLDIVNDLTKTLRSYNDSDLENSWPGSTNL
jgi:hypothetical protein